MTEMEPEPRSALGPQPTSTSTVLCGCRGNQSRTFQSHPWAEDPKVSRAVVRANNSNDVVLNITLCWLLCTHRSVDSTKLSEVIPNVEGKRQKWLVRNRRYMTVPLTMLLISQASPMPTLASPLFYLPQNLTLPHLPPNLSSPVGGGPSCSNSLNHQPNYQYYSKISWEISLTQANANIYLNRV